MTACLQLKPRQRAATACSVSTQPSCSVSLQHREAFLDVDFYLIVSSSLQLISGSFHMNLWAFHIGFYAICKKYSAHFSTFSNFNTVNKTTPFFFKMYAGVLSACMSVCCVHVWSLEEGLNPLELDLQMIVSCCVGAGHKPESSGRAATVLSCCTISPTPRNRFDAKILISLPPNHEIKIYFFSFNFLR